MKVSHVRKLRHSRFYRAEGSLVLAGFQVRPRQVDGQLRAEGTGLARLFQICGCLLRLLVLEPQQAQVVQRALRVGLQLHRALERCLGCRSVARMYRAHAEIEEALPRLRVFLIAHQFQALMELRLPVRGIRQEQPQRQRKSCNDHGEFPGPMAAGFKIAGKLSRLAAFSRLTSSSALRPSSAWPSCTSVLPSQL